MVDAGAEVAFSFDGRECLGREGEPVAVALWRNGDLALGRSVKYHRPRGPYCFQGACPGCMVEIDGEPNVRSCRARLREGIEVRSQVGVPNSRRDVFGIVDRVFDSGFDHQRLFTRPRALGDVYHWIARRMAGTGRPAEGPVRPSRSLERVRVRPDVLVIGAGAAGLAASRAACDAGATVLLADPWPGGHLLGIPDGVAGAANGPALAREREEHARRSGATVAVGPALGVFEDEVVPVITERRLIEARPRTLIIANGATESPLLVPNGDIPGVVGARALARLVVEHGWEPDGPVVVAGGHDAGLETALAVARTGARVAVAGEMRARPGLRERIAGSGVTVLPDGVASVSGELRVDSVTLDNDRELPCSVLASNQGLVPSPEFVQQVHVERRWVADLGGFVPIAGPDGSTSRPDVYVTGSAAGVHDTAAAMLQGELAGLAVAGAADGRDDVLKRLEARVDQLGRATAQAIHSVWSEAEGDGS